MKQFFETTPDQSQSYVEDTTLKKKKVKQLISKANKKGLAVERQEMYFVPVLKCLALLIMDDVYLTWHGKYVDVSNSNSLNNFLEWLASNG